MDHIERGRRGTRWKWAVGLLCTTGLAKGYTASGGPFGFGLRDQPNFTTGQLMDHFLLSLGLSLLILLIITDALNYKPIVVLGCLCTAVGWILFIWPPDSVTTAQVRGWLHGLNYATTELAYSVYSFAFLDHSQKLEHRRILSYTTASLWIGESLAYLARYFFSSSLNLQQLSYCSLGVSVGSCLLSLILPKVLDWFDPDPPKPPPPRRNQVIYSTPTSVDPKDTLPNLQAPSDAWYFKFRNQRDRPGQKSFTQKMRESPTQSRINFVTAYTNRTVVEWSLGFGLSFCIFLGIEGTFPGLILPQPDPLDKNGVILAGAGTLIPAVLCLCLAPRLPRCLSRFGSGKGLGFPAAGVGTLIQGIVLVIRHYEAGNYVNYHWACVILSRAIFLLISILTRSTIATEIRVRSAAFIFGINSLVAVAIFAGFKYLLQGGLKLDAREQSLFWAWVAVILGICWVLLDTGPRLIYFLKKER